MSRIGKKPITIPKGVEVSAKGQEIHIKGPKGEFSHELPSAISITIEEGVLTLKCRDEEPKARSLYGLSRALIQNMVIGVSVGFEKKLEIIGVGYRAQVAGKKITLNLGYSHPIDMTAPEGVTVEMDKDQKNTIVIRSTDKQKVGQFAANIRAHRPPEPYKGKGIKYSGEHITRKAGKTASK